MTGVGTTEAIAAARRSGGWSWWRYGVALFCRAPVALFALAVAAEYARLMPDGLATLMPATGLLATIALKGVAIVLEAACYAALIVKINAVAGSGEERGNLTPRVIVSLAIAGILYSIAVTIGFVLFLLPAVFVSITLLFFAYPIVLDHHGPIAGLRQSAKLTVSRLKSVSAAIAIVFIVYSIYILLTWGPAVLGVDWQSLVTLMARQQQGRIGPVALLGRLPELIVPGARAAPIWYFGLNPLLAGLVMPPVLAALYGIWQRLQQDEGL